MSCYMYLSLEKSSSVLGHEQCLLCANINKGICSTLQYLHKTNSLLRDYNIFSSLAHNWNLLLKRTGDIIICQQENSVSISLSSAQSGQMDE